MGGSYAPNDIRIEGLINTVPSSNGTNTTINSAVPLAVHHSSTLPNNPAFVS